MPGPDNQPLFARRVAPTALRADFPGDTDRRCDYLSESASDDYPNRHIHYITLDRDGRDVLTEAINEQMRDMAYDQ
jgi:hypothetical protein